MNGHKGVVAQQTAMFSEPDDELPVTITFLKFSNGVALFNDFIHVLIERLIRLLVNPGRQPILEENAAKIGFFNWISGQQ